MISWLKKNLSKIIIVALFSLFTTSTVLWDCSRRSARRFQTQLEQLHVDNAVLETQYNSLKLQNEVLKDSVKIVSIKADIYINKYNNAVNKAKEKEEEWEKKYADAMKIPADSSYNKFINKYEPIGELIYRLAENQIKIVWGNDIKMEGLVLENMSLHNAISYCDSVLAYKDEQIFLLEGLIFNLETADSLNRLVIVNKDKEIELYKTQLRRAEARGKVAIIVGGVTASVGIGTAIYVLLKK